MRYVDLDQFRGPCECGREHAVDVEEVVIGHDALRRLPHMLEDGALDIYEQPVVLCDANTRAAAGGQIPDLMRRLPVVELDPEGLHATEGAVALVAERLPEDVDLIVALGSGTIHDLARYTAHDRGIAFVSCPTAASVDGFVSTVAAMTWHGMKRTFPAVPPIAVVADTTVLSQAPRRLTASGAADLFGKYCCILDWRIAHEVTGEYICERTCRMALEAADDVMACVDGLDAGDEEAYANLIYALLLSGLAMQMIGNSRPASCAEHHMSHLWEMNVINDEVDALHGEKVGVGLVLVARRYKRVAEALREGCYEVRPWGGLERDLLERTFGARGLLEGVLAENDPDPLASVTPDMLERAVPEIVRLVDETLPDPDDLIAELEGCGCPTTMADLGLDPALAELSLDLSPYVRQRLSFNRLTKMIEVG